MLIRVVSSDESLCAILTTFFFFFLQIIIWLLLIQSLVLFFSPHDTFSRMEIKSSQNVGDYLMTNNITINIFTFNPQYSWLHYPFELREIWLRGFRLQECCSTVLLQIICTWSRVEVVGCIVENYNTFYGELYNLLAFLVACVTTNCSHLTQTCEGE